jgi:exodeoxyribonuclease V beta subunit
VAEAPALEGVDDLFAFPKGARAGIFFHDLLEHWDFQREESGYQEPLVAAKLEAHGFEARWQPAVARMLARLAHVGLPTQAESASLCLAQVPSSRRVNEMEFYFPLKRVGADKLKQYFREKGGSFFADTAGRALERLTFAPMEGFMKGYVDTIFEHDGRFYLLDWKSNHLGNRWEDYTLPRLSTVMAGEYYFLQYHLYVVALDQLLRQRVPEYDYQRHFGGVYYLFLRGIQEPGAETGIYYALPDATSVAALRELLVEK